MASGITATLSLTLLFFLINRLRQRKLRARDSRPTEDQRSMGSIGYMGGNISYMGGGSMGMDYPYDSNNGHFPLWKHFPRGEAPPPYDVSYLINFFLKLHD